MAKTKSDLLVMSLALVASLFLSGCFESSEQNLNKERDSRYYRSAMADYQAGRLDAAIDGFEKAVKHDPANASVRFQLACLLQDVRKDYLGAFCAYREYMMQHPKSDKASLAGARLAVCEKELALSLAAKYQLNDAGNLKIIEDLRKDLAAESQRLAAVEKELQALRERHASLSEERDRLTEAIRDVGGAETSEQVRETEVSAKEVKALLEEEDPQTLDKAAIERDVAELRADEREEAQGGSSILPVQDVEAKAKRDQQKAELEREKLRQQEDERMRHPPEYVVQEGDTLYRLAERFYGRISVWKAIRDANKAVISNDGRLKTGTRIVLPYGVR